MKVKFLQFGNWFFFHYFMHESSGEGQPPCRKTYDMALKICKVENRRKEVNIWKHIFE